MIEVAEEDAHDIIMVDPLERDFFFSWRMIRHTIHINSSKSKRVLTYGVYGTASFRKNAPGACITEATESINCPKKHCTHAEKKNTIARLAWL